jgi:hypothetical protein
MSQKHVLDGQSTCLASVRHPLAGGVHRGVEVENRESVRCAQVIRYSWRRVPEGP